MRTSCNGCRVLRKGNDNCEIRPCIEWIKSAESQANATLFLAKFYGRAGLLNLINAGSQHERPGSFKSLLYEACGRIVNPTYGSVGLLSSGNWTQCQAAVDAVLAGSPIGESNAAAQAKPKYPNPIPPFNSSDIRHVHVFKDVTSLSKTWNRFKKSMNRQKIQLGLMNEPAAGPSSRARVESAPISMRAVEAPWGNMGRGKLPDPAGSDDGEVGLELTLGFGLARNYTAKRKHEV